MQFIIYLLLFCVKFNKKACFRQVKSSKRHRKSGTEKNCIKKIQFGEKFMNLGRKVTGIPGVWGGDAPPGEGVAED